MPTAPINGTDLYHVTAADALATQLGFDKVAVIGHSYLLQNVRCRHCSASYGKEFITSSGGAVDGELEAYNVAPRLGEIQIPTLIPLGRDGFICPPSQMHILHGGIAHSELVIFENSGHFPYVEEPELFFNTVQDWIERHDR